MNRANLPGSQRLLQLGRPQRGVVLVVVLVALVVMLVASVALVRSFNTSLFTSGNLAFKRDLVNQGERAVPEVMAELTGGKLATPQARAASNEALNYSAIILKPNDQGIPLALLDSDETFKPTRTIKDEHQQVTIRYVVDRLCDMAGLDTALGAEHCNVASGAAPLGGSGSELRRAEDNSSSGGAGAVPKQVVYRLSIRVDGPRSTQAFFQTTFTL